MSVPIDPEPLTAPERDGEELVRAAQAGDREAFGELYRRHARLVHGVLLSRLPPEDADDLVQEVFVRAMGRIGSLRRPGAFPAWLCRLARNAAADLWRSPRRRVERAEPAREPVAGERPDAEAWTVLEVVRALPRAYRETLVLRLVEGMTGPEIAERTGLTPDSVRVNLSRGMRMLREKLGDRP